MIPDISSSDILQLCHKVGEFMLNESRKFTSQDIHTKDNNTLVSYVDLKSEEMLVEGLKYIYPQARVLAEEGTSSFSSNSPAQWIIDPLDGTTNYLFKLPCFCINIAFEFEQELYYAFTYHVSSKNFYWAKKGMGSFKNETRLLPTSQNDFSKGLYATGFPKKFDFDLSSYMNMLEEFIRKTRGIRRLGSAALDLAYLCEGIFSGFYERSLQPWDIAPGVLLARESGLKVTDFYGEQNMLQNGSIVAAHPDIHPVMMEIIHRNTEQL